jgi:predicted permease
MKKFLEFIREVWYENVFLVTVFMWWVLVEFFKKYPKAKKWFELIYRILGYIILFFVFCWALISIGFWAISLIEGEEELMYGIFMIGIGILIGICWIIYIKSDKDYEFKG